MSYDIKVDLIPDLPLIPYRNGVGMWEGICVHDTECSGDSDEMEVAYFKKNWRTRQAFVNAFVDSDSITQTAKWEYKTWAQGGGNARFLSLEMITATSQQAFDEVYKRTCWLAASKLFEKKLGVIDGVTLVSHDWVRCHLGGTTHTDPIAYLAKWGKSWADLVKDTKAVYDTLVHPAPTPVPSKEYACDVYVKEKILSLKGFVVDGRSFVPVRLVGEGLGCKVDYKDSKATIDGKYIDSTLNRNGTTYGTSAEIAIASGGLLEWDKATKSVHFSKG